MEHKSVLSKTVLHMDSLNSFAGLKDMIQTFGDEPYSFAEQALDDLDAEKEASYSGIQPIAVEDEEMDVLDDHPGGDSDSDLDSDLDLDSDSDDDDSDNEVISRRPSPACSARKISKHHRSNAKSEKKGTAMDSNGLRGILNDASKGVSQDTAADYQR